MSAPGRPPTLRIGGWRFEPDRGVLERGSVSRRLEPRAVAVLEALAAADGAVMGRRELLDRCWPGLHVSEEVLANSVYQVRRALGDDARRPQYIETIPRRGYRILVPVSRAEVAPTSRSRIRPLPGAALAASLLAAVAVAAAWRTEVRVPAPGVAVGELVTAARAELETGGPGSAARAAALLEPALARDAATAEAWALQGRALAELAAAGEIDAPRGYARARRAAARALKLAPGHPDALLGRALARWIGDWDWAGAERDLRAAIAARPAGLAPRLALAELLALRGDFAAARAEAAAAVALAPGSPRPLLVAGRIESLAGDGAAARAHARAAALLAPADGEARRLLVKLEEPPEPAAERLAGLLAKPRLRPGHLALHYVESGEGDLALAWLQRAVEAHDATVLWFPHDPRWEPWRGDPRYRRAMMAVEADT